MGKVIGIKHSTGEYQGNAYDNFNFFVGSEDINTVGTYVEVVKVKSTVLKESIGDISISDLIGQNVSFYYNKFGQVTEVNI